MERLSQLTFINDPDAVRSVLAARARRRVAITRTRSQRLENFWYADLAEPFRRGFNIWQTHGDEAPTLAGHSVNVGSSMMEQVASEGAFSEAFKKSIRKKVSAEAIVEKMITQANRLSVLYSIEKDLCLLYVADLVEQLAKARGLSDSYKDALKAKVFQGRLPVNQP